MKDTININPLNQRIRELEARLEVLESERRQLHIADSILNCSEDLVFAVDETLRFVYANPITLKYGTAALHCTAEEFMRLSLKDIAGSPATQGSDLSQREFKDLRTLFRRPTPLYLESNLIFNNRLVWLGVWFLPVYDGDGKVTAVVGMARDITAQRETQSALAAEKERLAVTLAAVADAVITVDTSGCVVSVNTAAEKLLGRKMADVLGVPVSEVVSLHRETDRSCLENPVSALLSKRFETDRIREDLDALWMDAAGHEIPVACTATLILHGERECIGAVLVLRDISRQRAQEEEMLRIQKLESVGLLAGGIAHDFNNILSSVMGNISLAQRKKSDSFVQERLSDAEKAVVRAQGLTNQLLTFSKGGAPIKTLSSVRRIIEESAAFSLIGSSVRRVTEIPDDLWRVEVDQGQIAQVIQNLVINADQAMPRGGTVTITAENCCINEQGSVPLAPGQYVIITVTDEGIGIPPAYLDRVFDPYFTTKENGTGLGLATTHSIIRRHGGHITVDSSEHEGTRFSVYLPATEERISGEFAMPAEPFTGSGRILIMDDEPDIRNVASIILDSLGYEVESCADGNEAVALYLSQRNAGVPFDAVIVDLTVPGGLGGKEALAHLKKVDPHAKVIVSSGYSNDPVMSEYKSYGFAGRVTKPYGVDQLTRVLRKVLGGKGRCV